MATNYSVIHADVPVSSTGIQPHSIEVHGQPAQRLVPLYGTIQSERSSQLHFPVSGAIRDIQVLPGQTVVQGEVIATLNTQDADQSCHQALAKLNELEGQIKTAQAELKKRSAQVLKNQHAFTLATKHYTRQKDLFEQKIITKNQLDDAAYRMDEHKAMQLEAEYQQAVQAEQLAVIQSDQAIASARANIAKQQLEKHTLRAPYSGKVQHVFVNAGQSVQEKDHIISLFESDHMYIRAVLSHAEVGAVKRLLEKHQRVPVKIAWDQHSFSANILSLLPDSKNQAAGVDIILDVGHTFDSQHLKTTRFSMLLPTEKRIYSVPSAAVYNQGFVFRVNQDGTAKKVPVTVIQSGMSDGQQQQVQIESSYLQPTEQIIVNAQSMIAKSITSVGKAHA